MFLLTFIISALFSTNDSSAVLLPGAGALCVGPDREEAEAVSHLLKKGCLARRFADAVPGCRPLNRMDALFQRAFYVTQYAKRKG